VPVIHTDGEQFNWDRAQLVGGMSAYFTTEASHLPAGRKPGHTTGRASIRGDSSIPQHVPKAHKDVPGCDRWFRRLRYGVRG